MKHRGLLLGLLLLVVTVGAGSAYTASRYLSQATQTSVNLQQCPVVLGRHQVVIKNNTIQPSTTQANLCDSLTITNLDDQARLIAFGPHDAHQAYDGVAERLLDRGQSLTVILNQAGNFTFHDHLQSDVVGYFYVTAR